MMMSARRFKSLLYKSSKLQAQIAKEQKRPKPDWLRLCRMKKLRLTMKDKMLEMTQQYSVLNTLYLEMEPLRLKSANSSYHYKRYQ
jgi:uncharacterized protein YdcH (DUF465 family)